MRDDGARCSAGRARRSRRHRTRRHARLPGRRATSSRSYVTIRSAARTIPARKAVYTGDVGHLDEDGYLFLLGRRDSMLKIMGNRVYPDEVAAQLLALPGVLQAEVVGVNRGDSGARLLRLRGPRCRMRRRPTSCGARLRPGCRPTWCRRRSHQRRHSAHGKRQARLARHSSPKPLAGVDAPARQNP